MPSRTKAEKMRDSLLMAIEQVKTGSLSPEKAKAMASLAHQVTASLDVELRVLMAARIPPAMVAARLANDAEAETVEGHNGTIERSNGVLRHTLRD